MKEKKRFLKVTLAFALEKINEKEIEREKPRGKGIKHHEVLGNEKKKKKRESWWRSGVFQAFWSTVDPIAHLPILSFFFAR